jgi:hypothetical protein
LGDAAGMATAREFRFEKGADARFRHVGTDQSSAKREHVRIVMLAGKLG